MSKIAWGSSSAPSYEKGLDRGVLYTQDGQVFPWNGLVSVDEDHSDGKEVIRFFDGERYRSQITTGEFSATVSCYTYPTILDLYEEISNGITAASRKGNNLFNFSYRTHTEKGYRIHLVYNAFAEPYNRSQETLTGSPTAMIFDWQLETVPVELEGISPSSHFYVDSELAHPWIVEALEKRLYGDEDSDPDFPNIFELVEMFQDGAIFRVTDHGDGTWTATGPDDMVRALSPTIFEITVPTAVYVAPDTYRLSSY